MKSPGLAALVPSTRTTCPTRRGILQALLILYSPSKAPTAAGSCTPAAVPPPILLNLARGERVTKLAGVAAAIVTSSQSTWSKVLPSSKEATRKTFKARFNIISTSSPSSKTGNCSLTPKTPPRSGKQTFLLIGFQHSDPALKPEPSPLVGAAVGTIALF